jgi:hypothetical protein
MTQTIDTTTGAPPATEREAWGYVSGRLSVLETYLLPRSFFEGILKSRSLPDARSMLAKTSYRAVFATDEQVRGYYETLDAASDDIRREIVEISPPHVMFSFHELPRRYLTFRGLFIRAASRGASPAELEGIFDMLAVGRSEYDALALHTAVLKDRESPQSAGAVARSLYLDSAFCTLRFELAESAPEESVRGFLRDIAVLGTWSAVMRSRWNGTSAETVLRWFMVPERFEGVVRASAMQAESNPAGGIMEFLSATAARAIREEGAERIRRNVDAAAGDAVREQALGCRMVTYGPERVLAFLAAFAVEQENLRLSLASVVSGVEPGIVAERLRREHV